MRWIGHIERMREKRNAYRLLMSKPERKKPLRRPRRRSEVNVILERYDGFVWTELIWLRQGQVEGSCEHGSETSGFIKYR
jgi:hypothetical protein